MTLRARKSLFARAFYCGLMLAVSIMCTSSIASAQQASGLFFSVFGEDAPPERGDNNHAQVIYVEIPESETSPVYLRIFDAEVGGYLDERHGQFNTQTRFLLLGGNSAARIFGGQTDIQKSPYVHHDFPESDIIHDHTFASDPRYDGRYFPLGDLPLEQGFQTLDGYRRFAFLALGITGNDGNFYDFVLSHDPNDKVELENYRMFAYDLTMRIPNQRNFEGQIRIPVGRRDQLKIATFGLNNEPIQLKVPFQEATQLESSPADNWSINTIEIPNPDLIESIGFNFFGSNYNNTFSFMVLDENDVPIAIPLPILDYESVDEPIFQTRHTYAPDDCHVVNLEKITINGDNFLNSNTIWAFEDDTLSGDRTQRRFEETGYHPYTLTISGLFQGRRQSVAISDSVFINQPPVAWAGGNRSFVAGTPMAFDGTVSEDPDGSIIRYEWDFGDGNTGVGARTDHTYARPGAYTVTLKVTDNSGSPCNTATATATVRVNLPPVARINAPTVTQVGDTITLDGTGSSDPDGKITEYRWEIFGELVSSDSITHYTVTREQDIPITLKVTDDSYTLNSNASASQRIRVNRTPIANAGADKHVSPNRPATFNGNQSRDPDGNIVRYEWVFPGEIIREGMIVQEGIAEPGDHYVYLNVTDNEGAVGTDSLYVRVNYPPVPIISGDLIVSDGVVALSAAESYDEDGEIISFEWRMGDDTRIVGLEARHTYQRPGSYNVQLTIIDDSGTFSSVQSTTTAVVVNQLPIARLNAPESGSPGQPLRFDASASTDPDGTIIRHEWSFGDGNSAEGEIVEHTYERPGVYQVGLAVYDDTDLEESAGFQYHEVTIKGEPQIAASYPARVAPGAPFEVDLSNSQTPGSELKGYYWFVDGNWRQGDAMRSFTMRDEGEKEIRFAVENASGLPNSRSEGRAQIRVNASPAVVSLQDIVTHEPTVFLDASASTDPDGDNLRFSWDMGDGSTYNSPIISHTYADGGLYNATLSVDDQQGLENSVASREFTVFVNREPQIVMELPEKVCVNQPVAYRAESSIGAEGRELQFRWDFGNGKTASRSSGEIVFESGGRYTVNLVADDGLGLPNSQTRTSQSIQVIGVPVAKAGEDVTACITETIVFDGSESFSGTGDITRWSWDFGDGNTAEGERVTHQYTSSGVYEANLTVECSEHEFCGQSGTASRQVTIIPAAVASFNIPSVLDEGESLLLDPSDSRVDGHLITRIRWEISNNDDIVWKLNNDRTRWERRSGRRGVSEQISVAELRGRLPQTTIFPASGSYEVRLHIETESDATCNTAVLARSVEIRLETVVRIASAPVLTPGQRFRFEIEGSGDDISRLGNPVWIVDGDETAGLEAFIRWESPGTYSVRLVDRGTPTVSGPEERDLDEIRVRVNAPPTPVITGPKLVTLGETVQFTASESFDTDGEIISYSWVANNGASANSDTISTRFDRPGTFNVTLTIVDNDELANSRKSITREVQVIAPDMLQGSLPALFCLADPMNLPRELGLDANRFENLTVKRNGELISFEDATAITFENTGEQHITIVGSDGTLLLDQRFDVYEPPRIDAIVPSESSLNRADNTVLFDASQTSARYDGSVRLYWDFGDGNTAAGQRVRHSYSRPGTYEVTVTAVSLHDLPCNTSSKTYTITITRN